MMDSTVIIALAAWAGVIVNAIIATMVVKDQITLPYRLNKDQRLILETLAKGSEWAQSAEGLTKLIFDHGEYQTLEQENLVESGSRSFRYNLSYLERKGAVVACFIPAQGTHINPAEVYYRITYKGWRKLGKWTKETSIQ